MKEALLYASSFIIEEDLMWFVPVRYNYLCCYNMITEKVEKKYRLPEGNYHVRMYDNILSYEGKLCLIPFNGSDVLIFDKEKENFENISMAPYNTIKYKFCATLIYENVLYMFPERVAAEIENPYLVVRVNLTGKEMVQGLYLDVEVLQAGKLFHEVFARQYFVVENMVYILLQRTNKVLAYNLKSTTTEIIEIGSRKSQYQTMYVDRDKFYFIDQECNVIVWDKCRNETLNYKNKLSRYEVEKGNGGVTFSASFKYRGAIYFIPRLANQMIVFDDGTITEPFFSKQLFQCNKCYEEISLLGRYAHATNNQHYLYLWDFCDCKFHIIDLFRKENKIVEIETNFEESEIIDLYEAFKIGSKEGYLERNSCYLNLGFFLKRIQKEAKSTKKTLELNVGTRILRNVEGKES